MGAGSISGSYSIKVIEDTTHETHNDAQPDPGRNDHPHPSGRPFERLHSALLFKPTRRRGRPSQSPRSS